MALGLECAPPSHPISRLIEAKPSMGKTRIKTYSVIEYMSAAKQFIVFNNSMANFIRSCNERLFYRKDKASGKWVTPPMPKEEAVKQLSEVIQTNLFSKMPIIAPYSREKIPELYSGRKKTIYTRSLKDLYDRPLNAQDFKLNAFCKIENLEVKPSKPFEDMIARVVQARGPRYNIELGVFLKPIEHLCYKQIDKMYNDFTGAREEEKTIMKGLNAIETAKYIQMKVERITDWVAIPIDASRFDQHCSKSMMRDIEHPTYLACFKGKKDSKRLKYLLDAQLDNKGVAYLSDGKVKYHIGACRASGDLNTGLGNCVLMCNMIFGFLHKYQMTRSAFINNGDDGVVIIPKKYYPVFEKYFYDYCYDLGYVMTIEEPVHRLEDIEFCQTKPVYDGVKYRMVRIPQVSFSKDSISIHPFQNKTDWVHYQMSIGLGGLSLTGGLPVMQSYYNAMIRIADANKPPKYNYDKRKANQVTMENGFYWMRQRMRENYRPVTTEARVSFYRAFGILPDLQICLEEQLDQMTATWQGKTHQEPQERFMLEC
jgi:hypothetical protein